MATAAAEAVQIVMGAEESLKGIYWSEAVVEDDTGWKYIIDNGSDTSANYGWYCTEKKQCYQIQFQLALPEPPCHSL